MCPEGGYLDADVAYLMGLIVARGTISTGEGVRQLTIEFPYVSLQAEGITTVVEQETAIRLGLHDVRERLLELLDADIKIVRREGGVDFVARFLRNSMVWRNILQFTEGHSSYPWFAVPSVLFSEEVPTDIKREFLRGYADVSGNVRQANRYVDGRHRVRLDILNSPSNWELPVQLCRLLQEGLGVPVQLITWGHPNLGRDFREHQLNIFAKPFQTIGFSFEHKQQILEEFVAYDEEHWPNFKYDFCPGLRRGGKKKPSHALESSEKLDERLRGKHFNTYWQICKTLGCERKPPPGQQMEFEALVEE
jgi:hypothetical protein